MDGECGPNTTLSTNGRTGILGHYSGMLGQIIPTETSKLKSGLSPGQSLPSAVGYWGANEGNRNQDGEIDSDVALIAS